MHDWSLISIVFEWPSGILNLSFRYGEGHNALLSAINVVELLVPKREEWGPSVSVNEVTGPFMLANGNHRLLIEMQSGDIIQIEAKNFTLPGVLN
jgi:hypothetical protein